MTAPLIDRQGIAARHSLPIRYVRDTLTKRPDFPQPVLRLSEDQHHYPSKNKDFPDSGGMAAG